MINYIIYSFLVLFLFLTGCASIEKEDVLNEAIISDKNILSDINLSRSIQEKNQAVKIVEVSAENFNITQAKYTGY